MVYFLYFRPMIARLTPVVGVVCAMFALGFIVPERKPTLIIFTGSDWCNNCRYLEKAILKDSSFVRFAAENTRLIIADFPQKNKQQDSIIIRNDSLAFLYNHEGTYPKIVLLTDDARIQIPFHRQKSSELIAEIRKYCP